MVTRIMNAWAVLALIAMVGVSSEAAFAQGSGAETAEKPSLYDTETFIGFVLAAEI